MKTKTVYDSNLETANFKKDELTLQIQKLESARFELDTKDKELKSVQKDLQEKNKLIKEVSQLL